MQFDELNENNLIDMVAIVKAAIYELKRQISILCKESGEVLEKLWNLNELVFLQLI